MRLLSHVVGIFIIIFSGFSQICYSSSVQLIQANTVNSCINNDQFNVGAGIYDITGPVAEIRMLGYASITQIAAGMYTRLYARAFVIESPCNGKRVAIVIADLGQLFQGVKQEVVKALNKRYGNLFSDENVMIAATHQHSGPGGLSTYVLYNLSTLGFNRSNFNAVVNGIVMAIVRANAELRPATIKVATGQVIGTGTNRSKSAYQNNPAAERAAYSEDVNHTMQLLRFDGVDGRPIGMINWFALHGVSMNNRNSYVNSDNKGYAAYLFEKDFHSDYGDHTFVAAFAQADSGDVTANDGIHPGGVGLDGLADVKRAALPQYLTAKTLYNTATQKITGSIDYRHTFLEMDKIAITPEFSGGIAASTCPPALGVSMLAGTADGEGLGRQGVSCDNVNNIFPGIMCKLFTTPCQGVKPIFLNLDFHPVSWVPKILPMQMMTIGDFAVAAMPFELTTMSGRRLRTTIAQELPNIQQQHIALSPLANAYAQYITTPEEYKVQRYEGASTLFGPWSLAALQQEFSRLARALRDHSSVPAGITPANLSGSQIEMQTGVIFDDVPWGVQFGTVVQNVRAAYRPGDAVQVIFWGGHPKNNFHTQHTFLEVQKLEGGHWQVVRRDRDWDTEYAWQRKGIANSWITITWRIPQDVALGTYRIVHYGDWKNFWNQKITPYVGISNNFSIR